MSRWVLSKVSRDIHDSKPPLVGFIQQGIRLLRIEWSSVATRYSQNQIGWKTKHFGLPWTNRRFAGFGLMFEHLLHAMPKLVRKKYP